MKDDAGNLPFTHNGKEYRIYNFNWRSQRKFLNILYPLQTSGGLTPLYGEEAADAQDKLFSLTQVKINDSWQFIKDDIADSIFQSVTDATNLYTETILVVRPFLAEGSENSPASLESPKTGNTLKKPQPTSRK